ncbi:MAG: BT_3928 family protein [Flavisolibacter sp.]
MRTMVRIIQVLVGVLFIFSGLVKANDPLGLSYKMKEFFELWNEGLSGSHFFLNNAAIGFFSWMHENSLFLSLGMITLEIFAGVALLLGWMKNFILGLLLILIVFFTFLTGYAFLSGRFTNCGCFGDCLPITPLTSFLKDLALLVMILFLVSSRRFILPAFTARARTMVVSAFVFFTLLFQWYVLNYLPVADCLPFKKGNNIAEQIKPPPGAVPDSFAIRFRYAKAGKQYEFAPENLPADYATYTFIDRKDQLIRKGNAEPAIKGFSLTGISGADSTETILSQPVAIWVFMVDVHAGGRMGDLRQLARVAASRNIPLYVISPSAVDASALLQAARIRDVTAFNCDFTVVRTAARTDPSIYIIRNATIINKYGSRQFDQAARFLLSHKF